MRQEIPGIPFLTEKGNRLGIVVATIGQTRPLLLAMAQEPIGMGQGPTVGQNIL